MFCFDCGAKLPIASKFCPSCGIKQPEAAATPQEKRADLGSNFFNGTITKLELITLGFELLSNDDDQALYEYEILYRRMLWVFGSGWVCTLAPGEGLFVQNLFEDWSEDETPLEKLSEILPAGIRLSAFKPHANGFELRNSQDQVPEPDEVLQVVESFTTFFGQVSLLLPWSSTPFETFFEDYADELEDHDDNEIATATFFSKVAAGLPSALPWKTELCEPCDGMPAYSSHGNLQLFFEALDEQAGWIVLPGQCCGTCAHDELKDARESEPQKASSPSFITYANSALGSWGRSGWISQPFFESEAKNILTLRDLAAQVNLQIEGGADDYYVLSSPGCE